MSTPRTADGVALRLVAYSDTSQIVTFWTREAGRLTGIAKGAKRAKSAFHGPFDHFGLYRLNYREKAADQLHLLTAADLLDAHAGLRADPVRLAAAGWCAEILLGLTAEGMPIPPLFELLVETLQGLEFRVPGPGSHVSGTLRASAGNPGQGTPDPGPGTPDPGPGTPDPGSESPPWASVLFRFEAQALTHLGHRPRIAACAVCGEAYDRSALYSPRAGGAVCARCARAEPTPLRVRAETLQLLDHLAEPGTPAPGPVPAPLRQELRAVLRVAYTELLERAPVALTLLPRG
jgi:recombinational DNA repair protein (RecF pathway)